MQFFQMHDRRRLVGIGSICALGVLSTGYHLDEFIGEPEPLLVHLIGGVLPALLSLLLLGGGVRLYFSSFSAADVFRILGGILGGGLVMALIGMPIILFELSLNVELVEWNRIIEILATVGFVVGGLISTSNTRLRRTQQVLEEKEARLIDKNNQLTQQNERLEQFASLLSHDLRNPLNVAMGNLELLREVDIGDEAVQRIDTTEEALERMDDMINEILTIVRETGTISEDELSTVTLSTVAEQCWGNVDTQGATYVLTDDVDFLADEDRLQHVFENLFRNAIDHGDGDVTIRVGATDAATSDGFYLEDDGPGIPEGERSQVFEIGFTTSSSGTGLGLYLVKAIADAHGWSVAVSEGVDGGARFEFTGLSNSS